MVVRTRRQAGFSLIEMMVVAGIMIVMLGMLMPTYSRIQETKARTVCQNNLRQIGQALNLYAKNQNGCYPSQYEAWGWGYWNEWDTLPAWPSAQCWGMQGNFLDYETGYLFDQCGANQNSFTCDSSNMYTLKPGAAGTGNGGYWGWICYKGVNGTLQWPCTYQFYTPFSSGYGGGYSWPDGPFWVNRWDAGSPYGSQLNFFVSSASQYPTFVNLKPADIVSAPLASDFSCMTTWAVYYAHGNQLNQSQSNVVYVDGHVETDTITTNNWFEYDNMWSGCYHYR